MGKYISFGQLNKNYLFILGSISVRFIITFIIGLTPNLSPNDPIYLLGFKSNIFSHPIITYCIQYLSIGLGGLILEVIFNCRNKKSNIKKKNSGIRSLLYYDFDEKNTKFYLKKVFFLSLFWYFAKISVNTLNNLGFNRVKYWPIEFIFLYFLAKKILNKVIYRHQLLSLSIFNFILYNNLFHQFLYS